MTRSGTGLKSPFGSTRMHTWLVKRASQKANMHFGHQHAPSQESRNEIFSSKHLITMAQRPQPLHWRPYCFITYWWFFLPFFPNSILCHAINIEFIHVLVSLIVRSTPVATPLDVMSWPWWWTSLYWFLYVRNSHVENSGRGNTRSWCCPTTIFYTQNHVINL